MKLLESFSGTGSVGMVARDLGYSDISLDLKNANIKHKQDELYKISTGLISEIFVSLF
ncbi:MAG: hypothetical protein NXI08_17100 [bacterium]|nr:hypothetical protein [bacterium]